MRQHRSLDLALAPNQSRQQAPHISSSSAADASSRRGVPPAHHIGRLCRAAKHQPDRPAANTCSQQHFEKRPFNRGRCLITGREIPVFEKLSPEWLATGASRLSASIQIASRNHCGRRAGKEGSPDKVKPRHMMWLCLESSGTSFQS